MTIFLELKEKLKNLYAGYGTYLVPAGKFLLALAVFLSINRTLDFVPALGNVFVVLILSLICAIIPLNGMVFLAMAVILIQCAGAHVLAAAFGAVLFLALWILYLRFASGEALALVLTPLAFALNIPAAVPIGFGLAGGPVSALSVACGLVVYYFMQLVRDKIAVLAAGENVQMAELAKALAEGVFANESLLVGIICCTVALLVVYLIRTLEADYAWQISVIAGGIAYIVIQLAGGFFLDVRISVPVVLIGTAGACLICFVLELFLFGGDYSRSKLFRFQDDEYYYYVKAVPKLAVSNPDRKIFTISREDGKEEIETDPETEEVLRKYEISRGGTAQEENEEYSQGTEAASNVTADLTAEFHTEDLSMERELPDEDGGVQEKEESPAGNEEEQRKDDYFDSVDFETKLTDTLKNL